MHGKISDATRKTIVDRLGKAASEYRFQIYNHKFWGKKRTHSVAGLKRFINVSLKFIDHSIEHNKREDNLYHAYNLMTVESENEISIANLSEMLEGQVAVLSSGYLTSAQALSVLDGLKSSALFREDQYSYILYPNKKLPKFLEKNTISPDLVRNSELFAALAAQNNNQIIEKDCFGKYHFNGNFKNASDLELALQGLKNSAFESLLESNKKEVLQIFETVFNHKAFTGRSGTFYGYEGLGSIYWHMVSKLQLAVQECCLKAVADNESPEVIGRLLEHYYEINEGIGVHKSPELYGAFPTDPYSHTPAGKGAQQPGMTGQVKEDILSRFGELGVFVKDGKLHFYPCLLRKNEFLADEKSFHYVDVNAVSKTIQIHAKSLCFTYCQIPIIYKIANKAAIQVVLNDSSQLQFEGLNIDFETSKLIFDRTALIDHIIVDVVENELK